MTVKERIRGELNIGLSRDVRDFSIYSQIFVVVNWKFCVDSR